MLGQREETVSISSLFKGVMLETSSAERLDMDGIEEY